MTNATDLIERLQQAKGPDRELDCLIAIAADARPAVYRRGDNQPLIFDAQARVVRVGKGGPAFDPHYYTGSIDVALSLFGDSLPRGLMLCRRSNPDMGGKDWIVSAGSNRAAARSWPLALCILKMQDERSRTGSAT